MEYRAFSKMIEIGKSISVNNWSFSKLGETYWATSKGITSGVYSPVGGGRCLSFIFIQELWKLYCKVK